MTRDQKSTTSSYDYDFAGTLRSVAITDARSRTVSYRSDLAGQVLERREQDRDTGKGDPRTLIYRFDGQQQLEITNDGTDAVDYQTSLNRRRTVQQQYAFRGGAQYGQSHSQGGQGPDVINSMSQGSAAGSYTVHGGETLGDIAWQLWGDANMGYKLGEANGLGAGAALFEGQRLTIPPNVLRVTNGAATFEPYDPASAIGDTNPTAAVPKGRRNKCGGLGAVHAQSHLPI